MQRLLITGASGELARQAAELVLDTCAPGQLILVSRNVYALRDFAERGVDVRFGDFADQDSLRDAFAGADRMLLVSITDLENRTTLQSGAIEAAVSAGVGHIIYTSGLSPSPPNPAVVAPSHHATEQRLMASGVEWTVLRNSLYAEYQVAEAKQAIRTGILEHNRGHGLVAYVSRKDCAAVAAAVLHAEGHAGSIYDITGPERYSPSDFAEIYGELGGTNVKAVALDDAAFVNRIISQTTNDDHSKYGAELVASFGRSIREGYMENCTNTVELLSGRPAITLRQVLAAGYS